jgi:hypothetical protein
METQGVSYIVEDSKNVHGLHIVNNYLSRWGEE